MSCFNYLNLLLVLLLLASCSANQDTLKNKNQDQIHIGKEQYVGTLKNIKEKKYLRVLTKKNSFNYFMYKGKQAGFEFEMIKSFVNI